MARDMESHLRDMMLLTDLLHLSYFRSFDKPEVKNRLMEVLEHITPSPNSLYMDLMRKGEKIGVRKAKLETAYELYKLGMSLEQISKIVKLSKDEIIKFISEQEKQ